MNIQSKSPRRNNFNWKQISVIAIVLGVAAFQYIQSQRNTGNQNVGQNGGNAQVLPNEIDLDGQLKKGQASKSCLLYTSPSPRDATLSRMPSSA